MFIDILIYDDKHNVESTWEKSMPYAPEQKKRSRERILSAAMPLFKARGFEDVSIDEVMAAADLTRGGFYAHFRSKSDLIAECFAAEVGLQTPAQELAGSDELSKFVDAYVSALHRDNPQGGCPIAALTQDVTREGDAPRSAYTRFLKYFIGVIDGYLGNAPGDQTDDALAILAQMVGTVMVARATNDPMLSTRILKAGRQAVDYLLPPDFEG